MRKNNFSRRRLVAWAAVPILALGVTACGSADSTEESGSSTSSSASAKETDASAGTGTANADETLQLTVITKDSDNPFWRALMEGAQAAADEVNAELTLAAGQDQTDAQGQIEAIENAISRGDDAILIAHNGPAVNSALERAREAGLYLVALDTPTDPADIVDITFASDNFEAGELIGQWTAGALDGEHAVIAMLDLFADKVVTIDYQRDQGFLSGMGIDVADETVIGDETDQGEYSGGTYEVVCHETTDGAEDGGRTAMETCLSINPDINVVFTANETSGVGAVRALEAAGINDALVTSIDGSCSGVEAVQDGTLGAVSQQYPSEMGNLGVKAVADYLRNGVEPTTSPGLDFYNTGIQLVTDNPVEGVDSILVDEGLDLCW